MKLVGKFKKQITFSNVAIFLILSILIIQRYPQIKENFVSQGEVINSRYDLIEFTSGSSLALPNNKRQAVVFWATWCGPCKIELDRIKTLVDEKKILPEQVLAISVDESYDELKKFLETAEYNFLITHDQRSDVASKFRVTGTPTILLLDESNRIQWRSTGLSPTLSLRLSSFLSDR